MKAINFQPFHFDAIEMREFERGRVSQKQLLSVTQRGECVTIVDDDDRILAIIGFYHIFDCVVEVYMIPSIYIKGCGFQFVRLMRQYMTTLERLTPVHRIQTLARDCEDRWMRALGFHCEGTLAKYTDDGLDFRMWARVKV